MRIGQYLQIGEKLKETRKSNNLSQRKMAENLGLSFSTYSNYENGYSEPQMEVVEKFCDILNISVDDLFGMKVSSKKNKEIETFADFLRDIIELDRLGVPVDSNVTYNKDNNELSAILELKINNAQIASFIPDWKKMNNDYKIKKITETEYNNWLNESLNVCNVPIKSMV